MLRKIICLLLLITSFTLASRAQFSKGMRMAGAVFGSAFFNSGKYEYTVPSPTTGSKVHTNTFGVSVSPNYGWFISDKTVVGFQFSAGYKYDKLLEADENDVTFHKNISKNYSVSLGGFARNYFSATGSFLPFAQASVAAGIGSSDHSGFEYNSSPLYKDEFKGQGSGDFLLSGGISIGATKMINPHIGLDIVAGYNYTYNKSKYKTTTLRDAGLDGTIDETATGEVDTKFTNHGLTLGVGLQIFLDKK
jgi:hypothetical protein